jgi:enolase
MGQISSVVAWEALDSRGHPTVACRVSLTDGSWGRSLVPVGASTGQWEVADLRDGGQRYAGRGTRAAVDQINNNLAQGLTGIPAGEVDEHLDGPSNVTLAVSQACLKAAAAALGLETWQLLSQQAGVEAGLPTPMVNIFSGGRHAEGSIRVQDFLAVPLRAASMADAIESVGNVRRAAVALVEQRYGTLHSRLVADEGGIAVPGTDDSEPLQLLTEAIERSSEAVGIAIDVAATQFDATDEFLQTLCSWVADHPIVSVEDPAGDEDWDGWHRADRALGGIQLVGDDFFATSAARVERAAAVGIANAVLIKPNQVGTISGAAAAVRAARDHTYRTIVSARSGDTEDDLLADLAVGWDAGQIKIGSLTRSERLAKYNRLLELEARHRLPYRSWETVRP